MGQQNPLRALCCAVVAHDPGAGALPIALLCNEAVSHRLGSRLRAGDVCVMRGGPLAPPQRRL